MKELVEKGIRRSNTRRAGFRTSEETVPSTRGDRYGLEDRAARRKLEARNEYNEFCIA
jgi:hypothetical protein